MDLAGADVGDCDGSGGGHCDAVGLFESAEQQFALAGRGTVDRDLRVAGDDELAVPDRRHTADVPGPPGVEEHSHCAQFAIGLEREQECSVGYVECAVRSHRQVQRPGEAVCESGSGLAAAENLGDLAGEARDEQAVADEGEVVETRPDIGKYGAVAGARVDPKDLSRGDLRGDDVTLGVELQRDRHTEIACDALGFATVGIDTPDVVGAEGRVVQLAVRSDLEGVG